MNADLQGFQSAATAGTATAESSKFRWRMPQELEYNAKICKEANRFESGPDAAANYRKSPVFQPIADNIYELKEEQKNYERNQKLERFLDE